LKELPIACSLVGGEQERRREAVGGLLNTSHLVERSCYPFFRFELDFQPGGEILLRVTGPEGTKQFISEAFLASSP
jgi:hypothetical protein